MLPMFLISSLCLSLECDPVFLFELYKCIYLRTYVCVFDRQSWVNEREGERDKDKIVSFSSLLTCLYNTPSLLPLLFWLNCIIKVDWKCKSERATRMSELLCLLNTNFTGVVLCSSFLEKKKHEREKKNTTNSWVFFYYIWKIKISLIFVKRMTSSNRVEWFRCLSVKENWIIIFIDVIIDPHHQFPTLCERLLLEMFI